MDSPPDESCAHLISSNAVAAIILLDDGKYLLQLRDNRPGIWYPNHWGCFGGAVDSGEEPLEALRRELREEIEYELKEATYFTRLDFDLSELGLGRYYRIYYIVKMNHDDHVRMVLHEGKAMEAFPFEAVFNELRVTPYDAFAIFLHFSRGRIKRECF